MGGRDVLVGAYDSFSGVLSIVRSGHLSVFMQYVR